jgi:DNA polymerase-3 subunit alpha
MPAVALTDFSNLFGLIKFYKEASAAGIKAIAGSDVLIDDAGAVHPLTLLVASRAGYLNLMRLLSRAWLEGQQLGKPVLRRGWLQGSTEGLLAMSGGRDGAVGQLLLAGKSAQAEQTLQGWMQEFPDAFYLELCRTGRPQEEDYLHLAVELAASSGCPVVATNDVRFLAREDFEAHEARVCIQEGRALADPRRPRSYSQFQYLRPAEEMQALFADLPEALETRWKSRVAARSPSNSGSTTFRTIRFPKVTPPNSTSSVGLRRGSQRGCLAWSGPLPM